VLPGDVIFWPSFPFPDGDDSDKIFIVLNVQRNDVHLILKTTSKENKYRPKTEGCHAGLGYYYIPAGRGWFKKQTWVALHTPYEHSASELDQMCLGGGSRHMTTLNDQLVRAIVNCFKKTDECSSHHLWLLEPA
jgi:hypothetical protein